MLDKWQSGWCMCHRLSIGSIIVLCIENQGTHTVCVRKFEPFPDVTKVNKFHL